MAWPRRSSPRPSTACAGKTPEQLPALDFISIARFGDVPLFFSFLPFSVSLKDPLQCIIPHCLWLLGVFSNNCLVFIALWLMWPNMFITSIFTHLFRVFVCSFPLHPSIFHPFSPRSMRGVKQINCSYRVRGNCWNCLAVCLPDVLCL